MSIEYGVKTKNRPNIVKDLESGDVLHIGVGDGEDIFTVIKVGNNEYVLQQSGHDAAYAHSRGVINQKIMDFAERYDAYYLVTKEDLSKLNIIR
ncbi:MAG: hypothetical protein M8352_10230 [ANME-2 cluster archaeon]|nr:hypothetical protein [ANME-2 cluster archaeon]MDF1532133.1 hypothetical protein [ANME-2 cluster archaeon]